jgi:anti-sigma B factor antagonist
MHWTGINERRAGNVTILDLEGQMTLSAEEEPRLLMTRIRRIVGDGHRLVLLNLRRVSYVDSMGVGEIVGAYTRVVREGGMLKLCGVSSRMQELLETTNIGTVIQAFADESDALRTFNA